MQAVSAAFTSATQAAARRPVSRFEVMWDGANWTDETANLVSHTGALRLAVPSEELVPAGDVGTATVALRNTERRYSWRNTSGALYARIGGAIGL